eukprot:COSAG05_NODE_2086_length_3594_cov_18.310730_6_plen_78_part_00
MRAPGFKSNMYMRSNDWRLARLAKIALHDTTDLKVSRSVWRTLTKCMGASYFVIRFFAPLPVVQKLQVPYILTYMYG